METVTVAITVLAVITIARESRSTSVNIHLTRQMRTMQIHTALYYLH